MGFVDQALINLFNKITDPTSVVRESEFQRTPDNIALMERVKGFLPKLTRGGVGLTDSERQALVDAAEILYLAKKEGFDRVVGGYENSVSDYSGLGIDFNRIKGTILSGDTEKAKRIGGGETNRDSLIGVARGGGSEDEIKEAREYLRSKGINW